ncbi:hypothetical protein EYC80_007558 [Monilinia laxa]|uniref:Uncharacterized protein n=1 Tax=Monilinia laxa TaxID=61186 RepID=A0A5N6JWH8_MONLA|nr:hypothetical protein EYC80_007558 [Monilinia laxa]
MIEITSKYKPPPEPEPEPEPNPQTQPQTQTPTIKQGNSHSQKTNSCACKRYRRRKSLSAVYSNSNYQNVKACAFIKSLAHHCISHHKRKDLCVQKRKEREASRMRKKNNEIYTAVSIILPQACMYVCIKYQQKCRLVLSKTRKIFS